MRDTRDISNSKLGLQKGDGLNEKGEGRCLTRGYVCCVEEAVSGRCIGDETLEIFVWSRFLFGLFELELLVKYAGSFFLCFRRTQRRPSNRN